MDTKIREIYNNYVRETKGNDVESIKRQQDIQRMLKEKQQEMDWREFEQYRDQIYVVAAMAEEGGFINGFKYAAMLMAECYTGQADIIAERGRS